eukprot:950824-Prymnesium_polylepis.1
MVTLRCTVRGASFASSVARSGAVSTRPGSPRFVGKSHGRQTLRLRVVDQSSLSPAAASARPWGPCGHVESTPASKAPNEPPPDRVSTLHGVVASAATAVAAASICDVCVE